MEEQQDNRQNGAKLNDNLKQLIKFIRNLQLHKFIQQNHVSRRGNGQPFRNALDQTQEGRFKQFDDIQKKPFA